MTTLTPRQKRIAASAKLCERTLHNFTERAWHLIEPTQPFRSGWMVRAVCDHLQALARGQIKDLLINVPPGCSKSTLCSVMLPVWWWIHNPEGRFLTTSYVQGLATRDSVRARNIIESDWFRERWGHVQLVSDENQKTRYATTAAGWRIATTPRGLGTGEHPDLIICLAGWVRLQTDRGLLPIQEIVRRRLPVRVRSFNHDAGREEWRPIEAHEQNAPRPTYLLTTRAGRIIELTGEHPVYVVGRGYVHAAKLRPGDPLHASQESPHGRVRGMRHRGRQVAGPRRPGTAHLLLARMPREVDGEARTPRPPAGQRARVPGVRKAVSRLGRTPPRKLHRVQQCLPGQIATQSRQETNQAMPGLPETVCAAKLRKEKVRAVLLASVRQRPARPPDGRQAEPSVCTRPDRRELHRHVSSQDAGRDPQPRTAEVLPVRYPRGRQGAGHPPHRLRQEQRHARKPGGSLQPMPQPMRRSPNPTGQDRLDAVAEVVPTLRLPDAVFNVRIASNHNYFAEGVLVHNCDDPHNVKEAESDADRQSVCDWWSGTIGTRGQTRGVRRLIVMQRLHQLDLSGYVLEHEEGWEHLCLPMRYEPDRMKRTGIGWQDPRRRPGELLWPDLYPAELVAKAEMNLGSLRAAGQLQQRPARAGGQLFSEPWFRFVAALPAGTANYVRWWDKAATEDGGDYSAGVLIAEYNGRYYVLDVRRGQWSPLERNRLIQSTADLDRATYGPNVQTWVEQEGGSGGKESAQITIRELAGHIVRAERITGSKWDRALPFAAQVEAGNVAIVLQEGRRPDWVRAYIDEMVGFPTAANDDQCLTAGTMVQTPEGAKPIEQMHAGELAMTRNGPRQVTWAGQTGQSTTLVTITMEDGESITGTPNHPIFLHGSGFVTMDTIGRGDILVACQQKPSFTTASRTGGTPIRRIGNTASTFRSTGRQKSRRSTSTDKNGRTHTVRFRQGRSFTTGMGTRSTIHSKTWSASPSGSTGRSTHSEEITQPPRPVSTWRPLGHSRPNGTSRQKVECGTGRTPSSFLVASRQSPRRVVRADSRLRPKTLGENIARKGARREKQPPCHGTGTPSRFTANIAAKNSWVPSGPPGFALIRVLEKTQYSASVPVYNLTVDGEHEYFANGILVHNCDASSGAFLKLALTRTPATMEQPRAVATTLEPRKGVPFDRTGKNPFFGGHRR